MTKHTQNAQNKSPLIRGSGCPLRDEPTSLTPGQYFLSKRGETPCLFFPVFPGTAAGLPWFLWLLQAWNKVSKQSQPHQGLHRGTFHRRLGTRHPGCFTSVVVIHLCWSLSLTSSVCNLSNALLPTNPGLFQVTRGLSSSSLGSLQGIFGADVCCCCSLCLPSWPSSILTHSAPGTQVGQLRLSEMLLLWTACRTQIRSLMLEALSWESC